MKNFYDKLSNRTRNSISISFSIIGFVATIMTILGFSLNDLVNNKWLSLSIVIALFFVIFIWSYCSIGCKYKNSVSMTIRKTSVSITYGDIFKFDGWKVIGCDTHFDTRVDDIVISRKSLHGQLVTEHGNSEEIKNMVEEKAKKKKLSPNKDGLYDFQLGTIIPYNSSKDNQTYLMLAMTELDEDYKARTNMAKFEQMLMAMWKEIDRVYASHDIVLPLLGTGITRFDDGPKDKENLLRCMLCTLNASGVTMKSKVTIVLYRGKDDTNRCENDTKNIQLYEYKNMFSSLQREMV